MRIKARSSSKRNSASARANSVLPTPVGPKKMNEPMGPIGVLQTTTSAHDRLSNRDDRFILPDNAAMQFIAKMQTISRLPPSSSLATGTPVHRLTTAAMSSSSTSSLSNSARWIRWTVVASSALSCFSNSISVPYFSSAARLRSYSRSAFSMSILVCSMRWRNSRSPWTASFSFCHCAAAHRRLLCGQRVPSPISSTDRARRRPFPCAALRVRFSSCMTRARLHPAAWAKNQSRCAVWPPLHP